MKRVLIMLSLVFMGFAVTSCYDDSSLWNSINDHEQRIDDLETKVKEANSNIDAISALLSASSTGDPIVSVDPLKEGDVEVGYLLTFASGKTVTIYHGQDGQDGQPGQDGYTPVISARQDSDGIWYWTLDGEWMTDENGQRIKAVGTDGQDGQPGKDAITPQLKIEDGYWFISYDNGESWNEIGKATGEDGLPLPPYAVYNIGNNSPENLLDFVTILQEELVAAGVLPADYDFESHKELVPMQPGDVPVTYADTTPLEQDFGFRPSTPLRQGLQAFAKWYAGAYKEV